MLFANVWKVVNPSVHLCLLRFVNLHRKRQKCIQICKHLYFSCHSHSLSAKRATVPEKTSGNIQSETLQNRDLSKKMMLSLQAQHISSILEKCISQVEIAATLPAILKLNSMSSIVDKELSRVLQEHQILTDRLGKQGGLIEESDGEQEGESRKKAQAQLKKDIKNSVWDLFRLNRARPDAIFGLRGEVGMEVGEIENILIGELKKFHSNMVGKLSISLDEELQLVLHKQESSSSAHNLHHSLTLEEEKVAESIREVDEKISGKMLEIEDMQSSLQEKNTQVDSMLLLGDKQCQSLIKTSQMKQKNIQQEIDRLSIQLNSMMLENRQAERVLHDSNEKVWAEIEYLIQKFDSEMEEKQAKLEINETDYDREEGELRKLEKPFSILEAECNQIQERRRLAEEKRQEEMRELELKTKAAIFAQAWWRGYTVRKALKNKGKSKKGKRGKGKKSK